jgi:hypothetical protein
VAGPGRPKGVPNKATIEIKELARSLTLGDPEWVEATRKRLREGKEAPAIVTALLYYGYGKPKETVELAPDNSLSELLRLAISKGY